MLILKSFGEYPCFGGLEILGSGLYGIPEEFGGVIRGKFWEFRGPEVIFLIKFWLKSDLIMVKK